MRSWVGERRSHNHGRVQDQENFVLASPVAPGSWPLLVELSSGSLFGSMARVTRGSGRAGILSPAGRAARRRRSGLRTRLGRAPHRLIRPSDFLGMVAAAPPVPMDPIDPLMLLAEAAAEAAAEPPVEIPHGVPMVYFQVHAQPPDPEIENDPLALLAHAAEQQAAAA